MKIHIVTRSPLLLARAQHPHLLVLYAGLQYGAAVRDRRVTVAAAAIMLVAAALIFVRLDQRLLWVDEAETALLGRSILAHGVPTAWDGTNLISQEVGREYGPDYVWRWTPWLAKYLVAGSFAVLGESTLTARLPFALLGLVAVLSMYPLAVLLFGDRWVGVLAMAFLALSVPFLLHVRQCRYYSPAILSSIWVLYAFAASATGRRGATAGLVLALTALFHANVLAGVATGVALVPCILTLGLDRAALRRMLAAAVAVLLLNAPWVLWADLAGQSGEELYSFAENFRTYLDLSNRYTFPLGALLLFAALAPLGGDGPWLAPATRRPFATLLVFYATFTVVLALAPWSFYRWTTTLLPVAAVLLAFMCRRVLAWRRAVGTGLTAVLLLTGVVHQASAWPVLHAQYNLHLEGRSFATFDWLFPLGNHLYEVSHPYLGPMEELVAIVRAQAHPDDRVFITYGDLVLKFYTAHEVRGGQSGQALVGWPEPEWVIIRSFFRFRDRPQHRIDADRTLAWLNEHVPPSHYARVPSVVVDVPWDNIAEPQLRWYREPRGGDTMQIYRRTT
jgi:hypothetical protein